MKTLLLQALMLASLAAPAQAEVKSSGPGHFEVESRDVVEAAPAEAYAMLGRISEWWNADHSYSGDASNLPRSPGGGLLLRDASAGGRIDRTYARRLRAARRCASLAGRAGAIAGGGGDGNAQLDFQSGRGRTEIVQNYAVAGHVRTGMEKLAVPVDRVMAEQLARLRDRLNGSETPVSR
jgi:opacity protein-like surface antigen